jgi:hypothetical protein
MARSWVYGLFADRYRPKPPLIREAGPWLTWALRRSFGVDAIVCPWRVVYIAPDCMHDLLLRLHELVHIVQIERDGPLRFAVRYLWHLWRIGYWDMPYEIEARQRALGASRWLIAEGKTGAGEAVLLESVRRYMAYIEQERCGA